MLGGWKVKGRENIPMEGPLIVAPIHFSVLDPQLVGCAMTRPIHFMAKAELFEYKLFGKLIASLGAHPIKRDSSMDAIKVAIKLLEEGKALLMFPEGTRGNGVTMGEIRQGITVLARRTGAPVLPVGYVGPQHIFPKGAKRLRRAPIRVVIGKPFTYAEIADGLSEKEAKPLFAAEIERRLQEVCREAGIELRTSSSTTGQLVTGDRGPASAPADLSGIEPPQDQP